MVVGQKPDDWEGDYRKLVIQNFTSDELWSYENGFYYTSHYSRIAKLIAHWELYKLISDVPGDVIELGVYKLGSFIRWSTFREVAENNFARKIIGFDIFGEFPKHGSPEDVKFAQDHDLQGIINQDEANKVMKYKGFTNYELIQGDILKTVPDFIAKNPHTRIALLHIDLDTKLPTYQALNALWGYVSKGGIVIIDDYASVQGANEAVDQFIKNLPGSARLKKNPYHTSPSY